MQHIQDATRVGSANLNMACEMQSIDARIQFGIEIQMQLAWCTEPWYMQYKCMNVRMHSIRYANFKYALVYHHKQVNKKGRKKWGLEDIHTTHARLL